jgi:hypothetical protein
MVSPRVARLLGLVVFLIGILSLSLVFFLARADLERPLQGSAADMGVKLAQRLGSLFIMGFVASSLAGRGCQMFAVASEARGRDEEPPGS